MTDSNENITFEEIMFTVIEATQDTFRAYMNIEVFAGKVKKSIEPIDADIVGIVGVAGSRVGYMILSLDSATARLITEELTQMENPDEETQRDSIGELINIIAGSIKSKYHEQYGKVDLGLPLIMSGRLTPKGAISAADQDSSLSVQSNGVVIPFRGFGENLNFSVMVYM
ncbi:chemotaxis protein CheX [Myxococcota bacterium]|nr:chemotaxis protein CheX [Myxococcota bacterium]MBU1381043.1 chemotaxis protein CheX [Myxococcota bacterium]MBU1495422.1 chemotaxis protein CheX [Myxococcota bacterium]